ncbi:MAG TPA: hypothetical protein IAA29_06260 [Candidatus Paenibacillus intestinavium]|nr:hypothetical protein [Candidatus Paenibacillus intestinavium]
MKLRHIFIPVVIIGGLIVVLFLLFEKFDSTHQLTAKELPVPQVIAENKELPILQSSYCWGKLGCADYGFMKSKIAQDSRTILNAATEISVLYQYNTPPTLISVVLYENDKDDIYTTDTKVTEIQLNNGIFHAPAESGEYYYIIRASWSSGQGSQASGDTSSILVIEVE